MSSMRGLQLAVMAQKTDPTESALATLKMVDDPFQTFTFVI